MPARVVGDALVTAGVALSDMAADGRGAAQFDRAHGTPLGTAAAARSGGRNPPPRVPHA